MTAPALGWILAGGRSRRMGRDKAEVELAGRPLAAHVAERLRPQCAAIVLNGEPSKLGHLGYPIVPDAAAAAGAGPAAGIATALVWTRRERPDLTWVLTAPVDTPFLPLDLAARLQAGCDEAAVACAASGGRLHPVVGLWSTRLAERMQAAVARLGARPLLEFVRAFDGTVVTFPADPFDPFFNVNRPEDLAVAEHRMRGGEDGTERAERI